MESASGSAAIAAPRTRRSPMNMYAAARSGMHASGKAPALRPDDSASPARNLRSVSAVPLISGPSTESPYHTRRLSRQSESRHSASADDQLEAGLSRQQPSSRSSLGPSVGSSTGGVLGMTASGRGRKEGASAENGQRMDDPVDGAQSSGNEDGTAGFVGRSLRSSSRTLIRSSSSRGRTTTSSRSISPIKQELIRRMDEHHRQREASSREVFPSQLDENAAGPSSILGAAPDVGPALESTITVTRPRRKREPHPTRAIEIPTRRQSARVRAQSVVAYNDGGEDDDDDMSESGTFQMEMASSPVHASVDTPCTAIPDASSSRSHTVVGKEIESSPITSSQPAVPSVEVHQIVDTSSAHHLVEPQSYSPAPSSPLTDIDTLTSDDELEPPDQSSTTETASSAPIIIRINLSSTPKSARSSRPTESGRSRRSRGTDDGGIAGPSYSTNKDKGKGKERASTTLEHRLLFPSFPASSLQIDTTAAPSTGANSTVTVLGSKDKKERDRRVLPARIRRVAGGGQEGMRELEDMIIDWLNRYGDQDVSFPDNAIIVLSTDPDPENRSEPSPGDLSLRASGSVQPQYTGVPSNLASSANPPMSNVPKPTARIIVPTWQKATSEDDDKEEARVEQMLERLYGVMAKGAGRNRSRQNNEPMEDTSDAFYIARHRKYEQAEKRQRARETEATKFERYKVQSRIDLMRSMTDVAWATLVIAVLSRRAGNVKDEAFWEIGRRAVTQKGVMWLRDLLVGEGVQLVSRIDHILPVEPRRLKADSRTPTPMSQGREAEVSPVRDTTPAGVVPARVAALRDSTHVVSRKRPASSTAPEEARRSASASPAPVAGPAPGANIAGDRSERAAKRQRLGDTANVLRHAHPARVAAPAPVPAPAAPQAKTSSAPPTPRNSKKKSKAPPLFDEAGNQVIRPRGRPSNAFLAMYPDPALVQKATAAAIKENEAAKAGIVKAVFGDHSFAALPSENDTAVPVSADDVDGTAAIPPAVSEVQPATVIMVEDEPPSTGVDLSTSSPMKRKMGRPRKDAKPVEEAITVATTVERRSSLRQPRPVEVKQAAVPVTSAPTKRSARISMLSQRQSEREEQQTPEEGGSEREGEKSRDMASVKDAEPSVVEAEGVEELDMMSTNQTQPPLIEERVVPELRAEQEKPKSIGAMTSQRPIEGSSDSLSDNMTQPPNHSLSVPVAFLLSTDNSSDHPSAQKVEVLGKDPDSERRSLTSSVSPVKKSRRRARSPTPPRTAPQSSYKMSILGHLTHSQTNGADPFLYQTGTSLLGQRRHNDASAHAAYNAHAPHASGVYTDDTARNHRIVTHADPARLRAHQRAPSTSGHTSTRHDLSPSHVDQNGEYQDAKPHPLDSHRDYRNQAYAHTHDMHHRDITGDQQQNPHFYTTPSIQQTPQSNQYPTSTSQPAASTHSGHIAQRSRPLQPPSQSPARQSSQYSTSTSQPAASTHSGHIAQRNRPLQPPSQSPPRHWIQTDPTRADFVTGIREGTSSAPVPGAPRVPYGPGVTTYFPRPPASYPCHQAATTAPHSNSYLNLATGRSLPPPPEGIERSADVNPHFVGRENGFSSPMIDGPLPGRPYGWDGWDGRDGSGEPLSLEQAQSSTFRSSEEVVTRTGGYWTHDEGERR